MDEFIKQVIEEKFASKAQQRLFFARGKKSKKWRKWAKEFADDTDFSKLPERAEEEVQMDEIVDEDGNIAKGDIPTDFAKKGVTALKTTDEFARATAGQMGGAGLDGAGNAARMMRYFGEEDKSIEMGEADMSGALGYEETMEQDVDYDQAKQYFEDELGIPEDETEERLKQMGYESDYPNGKIRLIENPRQFVEDYLESIIPKKSKENDVVEKDDVEPKPINPIIKKQINVLKQTLKDNGISPKQLLNYLKDNE